MTRDEIMALEAWPETDALVAESLGWRKVQCEDPGWSDVWYWDAADGVTPRAFQDWSPSTSIRTAMDAQAALPEDKRDWFVHELAEVVGRFYLSACRSSLTWGLLTASPLDRCKAILLAMTFENDV